MCEKPRATCPSVRPITPAGKPGPKERRHEESCPCAPADVHPAVGLLDRAASRQVAGRVRPLEESPLDGRELVYTWAGGICVRAGLEKEKAALLVVIGAVSDGRKELLAIEPGCRESTAS